MTKAYQKPEIAATRRSVKRRGFTHLDARGAARMVDVSGKPATVRWARAEGRIRLNSATLRRLKGVRRLPKGDAFALARSAGILAAKRTSDFVPLAHPLALSQAAVDFTFEKRSLRVESFVKTTGPTGVELEALMAVWGALITLYDMVKALQRDAVLTDIVLREKAGGRSGRLRFPGRKLR